MSVNGLLVIDKPSGITSHDVVARLRRILGERSIGHIGTLDPMATGVLVLLTGRYTRLAQFYEGSDKQYEGSIRFGFATDTYDAEGQPLLEDMSESEYRKPPSNLTLEEIRAAAARFRGKILQTPPPFSAKKINGVAAYKLARKEKPVQLEPVAIEVSNLEILSYEGDTATFRVSVSSGTYIRSIAHDLGVALATGAHLSSLRRTQVADFTLADSLSFEQLERHRESGNDVFIHARRLLSHLPAIFAPPDAAIAIRNGRAVNLMELSSAPLVRVFSDQRTIVAVCQRIAGTLFQPKVVIPED